MDNFNYAIEFVLKNEGGFTVDHAGPTNFGIVLRELQALGLDLNQDGVVDIRDIQGATREQAIDWYRRYRWLPGRFAEIESPDVATKVFDASVNMGLHQAGLLLQRALRAVGTVVVLDGKIGTKTIAATNSSIPRELLVAFRSEMAGVYRLIVHNNPTLFKSCEKGWLDRAYL